jgi:hypothetical protein
MHTIPVHAMELLLSMLGRKSDTCTKVVEVKKYDSPVTGY